mmetsp:Transcript_62318/g.146254  ORF Transcript_62318/g.146254 Transcript_62318/m.146254 type:complete len:280 (+) Transcript_62318:156-995(+)
MHLLRKRRHRRIGQVGADGLAEENGKRIYDDAQQHQSPEQVFQGGNDRRHQCPQGHNEAEDAQEPERLQHPGDANDTHGPQCGRVANALQLVVLLGDEHEVDPDLPHGAEDDQKVKPPPGPVAAAEEAPAISSNSEDQLQEKEYRVRVLNHLNAAGAILDKALFHFEADENGVGDDEEPEESVEGVVVHQTLHTGVPVVAVLVVAVAPEGDHLVRCVSGLPKRVVKLLKGLKDTPRQGSRRLLDHAHLVWLGIEDEAASPRRAQGGRDGHPWSDSVLGL